MNFWSISYHMRLEPYFVFVTDSGVNSQCLKHESVEDMERVIVPWGLVDQLL